MLTAWQSKATSASPGLLALCHLPLRGKHVMNHLLRCSLEVGLSCVQVLLALSSGQPSAAQAALNLYFPMAAMQLGLWIVHLCVPVTVTQLFVTSSQSSSCSSETCPEMCQCHDCCAADASASPMVLPRASKHGLEGEITTTRNRLGQICNTSTSQMLRALHSFR